MDDVIKALLVDDVNVNLIMLEKMISRVGNVEVFKAENGVEALQILEQQPQMDVILLDLNMPVMDGYETLRRLKSDPQLEKIPVVVVTVNQDEVVKTLQLQANDFLPKPYNPDELKLRVANQVRLKKYHQLLENMNSVLEEQVAAKTAELQQALNFSLETEYEISLRLGRASEFRDLETGMHIIRMSRMSHCLAELAGLPAQESEVILRASPLHDVGKIGIPDRILLKPGKLTDDEFRIMESHTEIGAKILENCDQYETIKAGRIIALQHHERWNGGGYPAGLKGEEIHLYGRIVAIADNFDALTSERPYKKAFSLEKTMEIMADGRGSFFDPELFDLFSGNLDKFVAIRDEFKDNFDCEVEGNALERLP